MCDIVSSILSALTFSYFRELFLEDSVDALGYAVVAGIVAFSHADWHLSSVEDSHISFRTVLQPLCRSDESVCHPCGIASMPFGVRQPRSHGACCQPQTSQLSSSVGVRYEEQVMKTSSLPSHI